MKQHTYNIILKYSVTNIQKLQPKSNKNKKYKLLLSKCYKIVIKLLASMALNLPSMNSAM